MREVIRSGAFVDVRMSSAHREDRDFLAHSLRDIPPAKQRRTGEQKAVARMKYYRCAAATLEAAGVSAAAGSPAAAELVQRRKLLRVMQSRMAEFAAGKNRLHTTHLWRQHHLMGGWGGLAAGCVEGR